jgi:hypothetical protein
MSDNQTFDQWCIVELFGHVTLSGRVTEQTIGGCAFIRLDVPEVDGQAAFTKLLGQGAIYSITPVSEEVAQHAIKQIRARPISVYYIPAPSTGPVLDDQPGPSSRPDDASDFDDDDYDDDE